jgi:hypothetical protein
MFTQSKTDPTERPAIRFGLDLLARIRNGQLAVLDAIHLISAQPFSDEMSDLLINSAIEAHIRTHGEIAPARAPVFVVIDGGKK